MINKRKKVLAQGKRFSSILMTPPFFFPYKKKEKTSRSNPLNKIKVTLAMAASLQEHHIIATLYSDRLTKFPQIPGAFLHYLLDLQTSPSEATS